MTKSKRPRIPIDQAVDLVREGKITGKDAEWVREQSDISKLSTPKRRSKYNNQKVEYAGRVFDSKKEFDRYKQLILLQYAGLIKDLNCQEVFILVEKTDTTRKMTYKADFTYIDVATGGKVIEDVKSKITRKNSTYIAKKKLMKSKFNIDIKEI